MPNPAAKMAALPNEKEDGTANGREG
ncbi:MAG: hypothetical protein RLZZ522_103, partial [Verrucomicrobiota bacterium]